MTPAPATVASQVAAIVRAYAFLRTDGWTTAFVRITAASAPRHQAEAHLAAADGRNIERDFPDDRGGAALTSEVVDVSQHPKRHQFRLGFANAVLVSSDSPGAPVQFFSFPIPKP